MPRPPHTDSHKHDQQWRKNGTRAIDGKAWHRDDGPAWVIPNYGSRNWATTWSKRPDVTGAIMRWAPLNNLCTIKEIHPHSVFMPETPFLRGLDA